MVSVEMKLQAHNNKEKVCAAIIQAHGCRSHHHHLKQVLSLLAAQVKRENTQPNGHYLMEGGCWSLEENSSLGDM